VQRGCRACRQIAGNSLDLELARQRDIAAGRHGGMIIDICQRPSRLQRSRREAAEEAGEPEAHAALRNADAKTPLIASHDRWLSHVRPMGSMYRYPPAGHVRVMKAKCLDTRMLTIVAGLSRSFEVTNNWAVPFATLIKNSLCAHRKSEFQHSLRRSTTCAVIRVS
jgi:hypothetical protein